MAAGDLTIDRVAGVTGHRWVVEGQAEIDTTRRAFAIGGTGSFVHTFNGWSDDDAALFEVDLNENASATATNGSVAIMSGLEQVNTLFFRAEMTL